MQSKLGAGERQGHPLSPEVQPQISRPAPVTLHLHLGKSLWLNLVGHTLKEERKRGCLLRKRVPAGEAEMVGGMGLEMPETHYVSV